MASQENMAVWRDCIRAWYPDYETKTYFVPPVVITRIPFDVVTVAGQPVLVLQCNPVHASGAQSSSTQVKVQSSSTQVKVQRIQFSDTQDDLALQRVLLSLRELVSEQSEPMFVISQLQFSGYLGEPCYAAAAKQFLRPQNLPKCHKQGDFDILVIHRHYGIITGEIKSVLSNQQQLQLSQPDVDRVVTDRVRNAIKQLNKSQVVLREITKDLDPNLAIHKLLILPYVTADILTRVVSSEQLKQLGYRSQIYRNAFLRILSETNGHSLLQEPIMRQLMRWEGQTTFPSVIIDAKFHDCAKLDREQVDDSAKLDV